VDRDDDGDDDVDERGVLDESVPLKNEDVCWGCCCCGGGGGGGSCCCCF